MRSRHLSCRMTCSLILVIQQKFRSPRANGWTFRLYFEQNDMLDANNEQDGCRIFHGLFTISLQIIIIFQVQQCLFWPLFDKNLLLICHVCKSCLQIVILRLSISISTTLETRAAQGRFKMSMKSTCTIQFSVSPQNGLKNTNFYMHSQFFTCTEPNLHAFVHVKPSLKAPDQDLYMLFTFITMDIAYHDTSFR